MYNKAFKTDSQRLAFFIPSLGFVFTWQWFRLGGSVAHYLTRRYTNRGKLCTKILILTWIQKSSGLRKTHILCLR
ncbi:hypothetical protein D3H41_09575 [Vibrio neocaledonicus]|nr:hypothetical protein D3H41_09575 [Vibrio neocaledonicus]